jgi:hypothetical protein
LNRRRADVPDMSGSSRSPSIIDPRQLLPNQRGSARQTLEAPAMLFDETAPFLSPAFLIYVTDVSMTGIGLRSERRLPPDSTYHIHLTSDGLRINRRLRVTRCERVDDTFSVGADFIKD